MTTQDLRSRRTNDAMLRAQDVAIGLFEKRGFDAVTMEDVARAAEVGVASVYRWFGTKEGLVLWDDYDPPLLDAVRAQLAIRGPLAAFLRALVEQIGEIYARDRKRILRRADLVTRTPALLAAARLNVQALRGSFAEVLAPHVKDRLRRELLAAVVAATLEIAVEEWRLRRGREPLDGIMLRAFEALERL